MSLDILQTTDQLLVKEGKLGSGILTDYRSNKQFTIKNATGQDVGYFIFTFYFICLFNVHFICEFLQIFFAVECTHFLKRNVVDANTAFDFKVMDTSGQEVVRYKSNIRILATVEVKLPDDKIIGYVERNFNLAYPKFTIKDAQNETILHIKGPLVTTSFGCDVDFDVSSFVQCFYFIRRKIISN